MKRILARIDQGLDWFADKWGDFFSSKWTVLLFALLPLVAAPQAVSSLLHGDFVTFVAFMSSNYFQLVALPVLAYLAARQIRADKAHQASLTAVHKKVDALHAKIDKATDS
jgi:hypothetical protein